MEILIYYTSRITVGVLHHLPSTPSLNLTNPTYSKFPHLSSLFKPYPFRHTPISTVRPPSLVFQLQLLMDADSWISRISSSSKNYKSALLSRSDMFTGFGELDGDEDLKEEFPCPFCAEYFDIVGLCCHIDEEHPLEAQTGVCPICAGWVGLDMVAHITRQHGNILKVQRKRKSRKAASHSTLSLLRRELLEGNLQSLFGSSLFSSSNSAPDPLLSSFILPMADDSQPQISELSPSKKILSEHTTEGPVRPSTLSLKDKEETAKRSEFVQGLLLSTILDETL